VRKGAAGSNVYHYDQRRGEEGKGLGLLKKRGEATWHLFPARESRKERKRGVTEPGEKTRLGLSLRYDKAKRKEGGSNASTKKGTNFICQQSGEGEGGLFSSRRGRRERKLGLHEFLPER